MPSSDAPSRPAVSFLTAVHGTEAHLAEMIDSVRGQTREDWELVVVDDRMTDEVVRVLEKYSDDDRIRLRRERQETKAGAIAAAAAAARGVYYAVLAGDGRLGATFCERVGEVLAEIPEVDVLCIDAVPFLGEEDQPPSFRRRCGITTEPGVGHRVGIAEVLAASGLYSTAAIRAEVWEAAGGWSADCAPVESLDLCLRMLAAGCDLRVLPEVLGGYRLRADNPDHEPDDWDEYHSALERVLVRVESLTDDPAALAQLRTTLRDFRYEKALRLCREAARRGDPRTARSQAASAFRQRPSMRPAVMWLAFRVVPGGTQTLKAAKGRAEGLVRSAVHRGR